MGGTARKRPRVASNSGSSESDNETESESGSRESISIDEAALHTVWDLKEAKELLLKVAKKPELGVFGAIRSTWGDGFEIQEAVNDHLSSLYDSPDAEPWGGNTMFIMLDATRLLAEKLLQVKEYAAAFFFAHAVAAAIRRCEESEEKDEPENVIKWAEALDGLMVAAVKGWRKEVGNSKKQKAEIATLVKEIETGERAEGYDQKKWYPETLKELRAWAG